MMKQKTLVFITALFISMSAGIAYADNDMHMDGMDMKSTNQIMLPTTVVDGVSAMAHLKDVKEAMAAMGMDTTHHFMVMFTDRKSGKHLEEGVVALKITHPDAHTDKPIQLMAMQDHFGSDITLAGKGTYKLDVGTKLSDGVKRTFHFQYTVK